MNEIKIYVKGTTGFKPVVKAKLQDHSKYKIRNVNNDNVIVLMAAGLQLKDLKASIGDDLTISYGLQFQASQDTHDALKLSNSQRSETLPKMNIWTSDHPNVRIRKIQIPQQRNEVPVF